MISIHASHAGRDTQDLIELLIESNFNPRVPCGTRHAEAIGVKNLHKFQSTRPMRDATLMPGQAYTTMRFQSTRPMRDATLWTAPKGVVRGISIHASHAGRDPFKII